MINQTRCLKFYKCVYHILLKPNTFRLLILLDFTYLRQSVSEEHLIKPKF